MIFFQNTANQPVECTNAPLIRSEMAEQHKHLFEERRVYRGLEPQYPQSPLFGPCWPGPDCGRYVEQEGPSLDNFPSSEGRRRQGQQSLLPAPPRRCYPGCGRGWPGPGLLMRSSHLLQLPPEFWPGRKGGCCRSDRNGNGY